jgi:hypothetical protein
LVPFIKGEMMKNNTNESEIEKKLQKIIDGLQKKIVNKKNRSERLLVELKKYLTSAEAEKVKTILELTNSSIRVTSYGGADDHTLFLTKEMIFQSSNIRGRFDLKYESLSIQKAVAIIVEFCPKLEIESMIKIIREGALEKKQNI